MHTLPSEQRTYTEVDRRDPAPVARLRPAAGGVAIWRRALRVRQWTKNLLVFGAPAAAAELGRPGVLARVATSFVVFCLLASGAYLINDVRDAAEDRRHPRKRHRPIASGAIPAGLAAAVGCGLILLGLATSALVSQGLLAAAGGYAALNVAYTTFLRGVAFADIGVIAAAFVLRAVAGGIAAQVPISRWFIVVVSLAALFVAAGKRYADFLDPASRRSRPALDQYTAGSLRVVISLACALALGAYCLWAFEAGHLGLGPWRELTIVPFGFALLRYALIVRAGGGGAPESIVFQDRLMQLAGVSWLVMFIVGV